MTKTNKTLLFIALFTVLTVVGIFSTGADVVKADYYDEGLPSCALYSSACHSTPGLQTNHDSGQRVNGSVYMTCDGLANGSIAGEMIQAFGGQLCGDFEDDPNFGGYCVVAKCSLGGEEGAYLY